MVKAEIAVSYAAVEKCKEPAGKFATLKETDTIPNLDDCWPEVVKRVDKKITDSKFEAKCKT